MIIDIHAHAFGDRRWVPEQFWQSYVGLLASNLGKTVQEVEDTVLPDLWDPNGDRIVAEMDRAGIDKAAVLCLEWGLLNDDEFGVEALHDAYEQLVSKHEERLILGVGVDPRRANASALLKRGLAELGARMLKLYPPMGFYPNDEIVYPLYKQCSDAGIPVLLHTGPAVRPFRSKFSNPVYLDDVANDFPELTIIIGHVSHGWWRDALALARSKHNLVLDFSGWGLLSAHPRLIMEPLREMMDVAPGRVAFGTDYIGLPGGMERFARLLRDRYDGAPEFSQAEMDAFFGETARGWLHL